MRRVVSCAVLTLLMTVSVDAGAPLTGSIGSTGTGIYYGGPDIGITGAIGGINGGGVVSPNCIQYSTGNCILYVAGDANPILVQ